MTGSVQESQMHPVLFRRCDRSLRSWTLYSDEAISDGYTM